MVRVKEDMTGWKMWEHGVPDSRIIVFKQTDDYIHPNGSHRAQWKCLCNCGKEKNIIAQSYDIKTGKIKSCGCLRRDKLIQRDVERRKTNKYSDKLTDEYGDYYIGWTNNTNNKFYIDADDFELIKNYNWFECNSGKTKLLKTNKDGTKIGMHQLLGFKHYDHIDRNELNNRRSNLRPCSHQENCYNRSVRSDNTSGITGG